MLKPIPARILRSTAAVDVCAGLDRYQNRTYESYTVERVHLQPSSEVRKSPDNTEQSLRAVLFVDARRSSPRLDWPGLFQAAHMNGGDMKITVRGIVYTVAAVDELVDDTDRVHHWEISLT